ncbi:MAG: SDR family oxidoreductase [Gammaproteobacteria bacterium]
MTYFVTGATGFIGRRLVNELLKKRGTVYFLVRRKDPKVLASLYEYWGVDRKRAVAIKGDLTKKQLGVSKKDRDTMAGNVRHVYHLAALYDITAPEELQEQVNVEGTRQAVSLAEGIKAKCFHHVSSIAAAGLYKGVFREDMFAEATGLSKSPYHRTKHDAEGVVRTECSIGWRVYRPGIVVGDSRTGEMDKIDGPYYFFKTIQKTRALLPPWFPTVGIEGGRINLVPVDFVVDALVYLSHAKGMDKKCFHLTDPNARRIGDVLNIFAKAAHAPSMVMRLNARMFDIVPKYVRQGLWALTPVRRMVRSLLSSFHLPLETFKFINYPTDFDSRETTKALAGSGISVPPIEDYSERLWDYWERNLDPDLFIDRSLSGRVKDKVVMVTGASSGIGRATAIKMGEGGATVVLIARSPDKLEEARKEVAKHGGNAHAYTCDLSDLEDCDRLVAKVIEDLGQVDILVNNAGRSIRRGIASSFDRFHDFERTMQLNYFGSLRLIMGLLPTMTERRSGHVINISSIGVLSNAPRFSAYVASKAALDAFTRCAASELSHSGMHFTTINMPLVRTPMIAPTKLYQNVPTKSPEEAADMVVDAIVRRPKRIATRLGISAEIMHLLAPKMTELGMNEAFQLFPDSAAAQGKSGHHSSPEQIAVAQLKRGIHW